MSCFLEIGSPVPEKNIFEVFFYHMSCVIRKTTLCFRPGLTQNQAVQLQKMARILKFWIPKVNGLYYLCSENKDADQLRICKMLLFSSCGLYMGGRPSWSCDQDAFNKLSFPLHKEAPHKILL